MSTPLADPTVLADPGAAFWATDPSTLPTPDPLATPLVPPAVADWRTRVSHEIAAAVITIASVITKELLANRPEDPAKAAEAAHSAWRRWSPTWARLTVPILREAYLTGQLSGLRTEELTAVAGIYAEAMGDYLDTSSADSFAAGFYRQLAGRVSESLAWHRAASAYGLDNRQMGSYVAGLMAGTDAGQIDPVPALARALAHKALLMRAERIGEDESYSALQNAQALAWLYLHREGKLPESARREWFTAEDERVCPRCFPLDHALAPLDEPFTMPDGTEIWSPRAHPGCTCRVVLVDAVGEPVEIEPEELGKRLRLQPVSKAAVDTELRDRRGRWTTTLEGAAPTTPTAPTRAPPPSLLDQRSALLNAPARGNLVGRSNLVGQSSLLNAPTLTGQSTLLNQQAAQATAAPAVIRIRVTLPFRPAPRPRQAFYVRQADIQGYLDDQWGGILPNADLDFDDIKHHVPDYDMYDAVYADDEAIAPIHRIEAHVHGDEWDAAPVEAYYTEPEWQRLLAAAAPVWDAALAHADTILDDDRLSQTDLMNISARAFHGSYASRAVLAARIKDAIADTANPDRSLANAYADYVTFAMPELIPVHGEDFDRYLAVQPDRDLIEAEPPTIFHLGPELAEDASDLTDNYRMTGGRYRSVMAEFRNNPAVAPHGRLNVMVVDLEPAERGTGPSPF